MRSFRESIDIDNIPNIVSSSLEILKLDQIIGSALSSSHSYTKSINGWFDIISVSEFNDTPLFIYSIVSQVDMKSYSGIGVHAIWNLEGVIVDCWYDVVVSLAIGFDWPFLVKTPVVGAKVTMLLLAN